MGFEPTTEANMGDLVQREHPQNCGRIEVGQDHIKAVISPKWCKIGPRLLLLTNKEVAYALSIGTKINDLG